MREGVGEQVLAICWLFWNHDSWTAVLLGLPVSCPHTSVPGHEHSYP